MKYQLSVSGVTAAVLGGLCALVLAGCGTETVASHAQSAAPATAIVATPIESSATADSTASNSEAPASPAPETVVQKQDDSPKPPQTSKRLPADRQPRRPGDAEKITWDDLNLGMQADIVFRPFMVTDRVRDLEGQRVSIDGYMHGGTLSQRGIKSFVLLKNTECKFGPGGQADHLSRVFLREGQTTDFTKSPVKVEGKLVIETFTGNPDDQNTWAIYRLDEAVVK